MLTWDEYYATTQPAWGAPPDELLVEVATSLPRGAAVDFGCGEGRNSLWLATRGWTVTAIDSSQVAIDRAREIAANAPRTVRERLDYRTESAADTALERQYELALIFDIHVPEGELRAIVNRAISALKPDGILMISGFDKSDSGAWKKYPIKAENLYDTTWFTEELEDRITISHIGQQGGEGNANYGARSVVVGGLSNFGA